MVLSGTAESGESVGGLARLGYENCESARLQRRFAITKLGGDIDIDRQASKALEPVPRDQSRVVGGPASRDRDPLELPEVKRELWGQQQPLGCDVEMLRDGVADDFGLLMDLLRHEVLVIALVNEEGRCRSAHDCAFGLAALCIANLYPVTREQGGIAILEIRDRIGKGSERNSIGAEKHFAFAITDGERRALARSDQKIFLALKQEGEREGPAQPRQSSRDCIGGRVALAHLLRDEMCHNLSVGLRGKLCPPPFQLVAQLAKILDD